MAGETAEEKVWAGDRGWGLWRGVVLSPWMVAPLLYVVDPSVLQWARVEVPAWLRWWGVGLGALSVGLLAWTHEALAQNFSSALRIRAGHRLVTTGPYRWVRHPMYSVAMLAWLALGLAAANGFIALGAAVFLGLVWGRIGSEESMLVEAFGAGYRDYQGRTGCLWPRGWWHRSGT